MLQLTSLLPLTDDATWSAFAVWTAVMLGLYTIGLPFLIAVVLWRHRNRLQGAGTIAKLGFL